MTGPKTYWHLMGARRMPSQYEIATTDLLYTPRSGFAVRTPMNRWTERCWRESPLRADDWERFSDPAAMTYDAYVGSRREAEAYLEGLEAASIEAPPLSDAWVRRLDRGLAPLRYPCHALMMVAGYLGSVAPSGKIVVAAGMQALDQMRRVHRLAYRLRRVQSEHAEVGRDARGTWERDPAWQPCRELLERLLVTWDWGESFAAAQLVVGPVLDALAFEEHSRVARDHDDGVLARVLGSLGEDGRWHRAWARALVATAIDQRPDNRDVLRGWVEAWRPRAEAAVAALAPVLGGDDAPARVAAAHDRFLRQCGLTGGEG